MDLPPLRMMTRREQPLKVREQRVDEIGDSAVAGGKDSYFGGHYHGSDGYRVGKFWYFGVRNPGSDGYRVGRLLARHEPGVVGGRDPGGNIGLGHRRCERY